MSHTARFAGSLFGALVATTLIWPANGAPPNRMLGPNFPALVDTFDDPFFDQPYQAPAVDAAPAWEAAAKAPARAISSNIKPKRKVAALFKAADPVVS